MKKKNFSQAMWKVAKESRYYVWTELAEQFDLYFDGYEKSGRNYYVDLVSCEKDFPAIYGGLNEVMGVDYVRRLTCVFRMVGSELKLVKVYPIEDEDDEEEDEE